LLWNFEAVCIPEFLAKRTFQRILGSRSENLLAPLAANCLLIRGYQRSHLIPFTGIPGAIQDETKACTFDDVGTSLSGYAE
jgi:hypothetical protein